MLVDISTFKLLYSSIYFFTVSLVLISILSIEIKKDLLRQQKIGNILVFLPLLFLVLLVGLRDYNIGSDTYSYYEVYWVKGVPIILGQEFIFPFIILLLKYFGLSYSSFLILISFLFYFILYRALFKISQYFYSNVFFIFFVFISFFFSLSLSTNVIRQGLSLVLILFIYSCWLKKENKVKIIFFMFLSFSLHMSSIIPVIIFFLCFYFKSYALCFMLYALSIILSYFNIGVLDVFPYLNGFIANSSKISYFQGESFGYEVGFKPQFVIFNTIILLISIYINSLIADYVLREKHRFIINYYILCSVVFFMAFQLPFSDRWGLFSWIVIPILMAPLFSIKYVKKGIRIHWILFFILIYLGFNFYAKSI